MKFLPLLSLFLSTHLLAAPALSRVLTTEEGSPSPALLKTLKAFDIQNDGTWKTIVFETQKKWIRPPNKERWEVADNREGSPEHHLTLFRNLEMVDEIQATQCCYDYAVVLGATVDRVRDRFGFLKREWERGVRFKKLVILTGDRPLNPEFEDRAHLTDPKLSTQPFRIGWKFYGKLPSNETEMMQLVYDQMALPRDWDKIAAMFVDTPQQEGKRPNTKDTFRHWLTSNPASGSLLILSDQPFLGRADTLARKMMPPTFSIETVGAGIPCESYRTNKKALPILQDELARWLFELKG